MRSLINKYDIKPKHILLLLYWIVYLVLFRAVEYFIVSDYTILHSPLDDLISFNEFFVVPYLYWFAFMALMVVYTFLHDKQCFEYFMKMVIIVSITSCVVYVIYPNGLNLRPESFERDNIFTKIVSLVYRFDSPVNVCPSLHVSGALITLFTSQKCKSLSGPRYRLYFWVCTVLICASTVFLKQHSVIDVFWGIVLALISDLCIRMFDIIKRKCYD